MVGTGCAIVGLVLLPRGGLIAHALARQGLNRLSHSFLVLSRGEERGVARVGPEDGAILGKNPAFRRPRLEVDSDARKLLPSALSDCEPRIKLSAGLEAPLLAHPAEIVPLGTLIIS